MKKPPTGYTKSKCQKKMRISEDTADELFSLNTQAGTSYSHELRVEVKGSATPFG